MFPLLPKLPDESSSDRWLRSLVPMGDADEMLCIESNTMEALLRKVLEARFDASLDHGRDEMFPDLMPHFDWYFDNAYTVEACRDVCGLMRDAADKLAGFPGDACVCIAETGDVMARQPSEGGWWRPPGGIGRPPRLPLHSRAP